MRIGAKIGGGFSAIVIVTIVLGAAGWVGLDRYAESVREGDAVAAIADRVGKAAARVSEYRSSSSDAARSAAVADLEAAQEGAARIGAASMSESIVRFGEGFANYVALAERNAQLVAAMRQATAELEASSEAIRDREQGRYAAVAERRAAAVSEQNDKLSMARAAEALIRINLEARRHEAIYRATRSEDSVKGARNAIKGMFLGALKLKKAAGDGPQAAAASKLADSVNGYRRAFDGLTETAAGSPEAEAAASTLAEVSQAINDTAQAITDAQVADYDKAKKMADSANELLDRAVQGMIQATALVADLRTLRLQQDVMIRAFADEPSVARAIAAHESVRAGLAGLSSSASTDEIRDAIDDMLSRLETYRASMDDLIATLRQQVEATQVMAAATTAVSDAVGQMTASSAEARNADGRIAQAVIGTGTLAAVVLAILIAWLLSRSISLPIRRMTGAMDRLAANDLAVEVPGTARKDEIADMAKAVQVFKDNALRISRLESEREEADRRAEQEKRRALEELASQFESTVGAVVAQLTGYVNEVRSQADTMSSASEEARTRAASVASTSEQSSSNVQAVSAAAEELAASIGEIGQQVSQAAEMARQASEETHRSDTRIQALAGTAQKIGDVITLIQDIAEQTNLLALNATIEAARAGDAGKGFAVVASEVKSLATQTAKATEEIRIQIEEVQSASRDAVEAIQAIGQAVGSLDEMNSAVASAVEEQSATTQEIARNTQEAANGSQIVSAGITEVSSASERTGESANRVLSMCGDLANTTGSLEREIHDFIGRIRTG